ncbi:MAG: anti-sigma factor domain-containing protein [Sphingomonadaceae bacterium]
MSILSDDDLALAAEYALKLLNRAEQAQAEALIATSPAFAAEVSAWEKRLEPLAVGADEAPPPYLWDQIEAKLSPATLQERGNRMLRLWQGLTLLSGGVAAALALILINQPVAVPQQAPLIAALGQEREPSTMTASYDRVTGALTLMPVSLNTGALSPELWLIDHGGSAHSLGIIVRDHPSQITVPAKLRTLLTAGATLAVTPEPSGGAPGGKATGPVISSGKITTI